MSTGQFNHRTAAAATTGYYEESGGGDVILRNGSVAIDVSGSGQPVDESTRLYTVSDEEDGLGIGSGIGVSGRTPLLMQHMNGIKNGKRKPESGGNGSKKPYPREIRKTVVALLIMCLNFVLTTASLSIVHEYLPDYKPLPDLILDALPYQNWALFASELTIQIQVGVAIAMIVFHKHRYYMIPESGQKKPGFVSQSFA